MTSDADGYFLVEVLVAAAIVGAAFLAMADALSTSRLSGLRRERQTALALCGEGRLATTLIGPGTPDFPCDPALRVESDSAPAGGGVEEVRWRLTTGETSPEIFTVMRLAR